MFGHKIKFHICGGSRGLGEQLYNITFSTHFNVDCSILTTICHARILKFVTEKGFVRPVGSASKLTSLVSGDEGDHGADTRAILPIMEKLSVGLSW